MARVSKVNESLELSDSMKEMKADDGDRGQENGQEGKDGGKKCRRLGKSKENREREGGPSEKLNRE